MIDKAVDLLENHVTKEHRMNIHQSAFVETLNILLEFVVNGKQNDKLAWVCDAVMGSGKTTALEVLLKYLSDKHPDTPLLLVFGERSLMRDVYNTISDYGRKRGDNNLIEYVDSDNVNDVSHTLKETQFICITHHRYRDLSLNHGNWYEYKSYNKGSEMFPKWEDRLIIVDEMPILFDSCVFDISSNDNSVDWFDKLADDSDLTASQKQFGRTMIMMLMTYELLESEGKRTTTNPLIDEKGLTATMQQRFNDIMNKIKGDSNDYETIRKFQWFNKLLHQESVGAIDRHDKGSSILCSKLIPYHEKGKILILDGTAKWNEDIYKQYYDIKHVKNYHSYTERVKLYINDINTGSKARDNQNSDVHGKISSDLRTAREEQMLDIFPLASKKDVKKYIANNTITFHQKKFYQSSIEANEETLPINLLNTRGKEELSKYKGLALLNLPIRPPQHYKKMAIGIYGVDVNLEQYERRGDKESIVWFKDERIQGIYEGSLLSDILQIIHRSNLREIKEESKIHILLYTHLVGWGKELKNVLNVTNNNYSYQMTDDKYNFKEKCKDFAGRTKRFLQKYSDEFNDNPSFSAGQIIKGDSFKKWLNNNWEESHKKTIIIEEFENIGIEILTEDKKGFIWKKFRLKDWTY